MDVELGLAVDCNAEFIIITLPLLFLV